MRMNGRCEPRGDRRVGVRKVPSDWSAPDFFCTRKQDYNRVAACWERGSSLCSCVARVALADENCRTARSSALDGADISFQEQVPAVRMKTVPHRTFSWLSLFGTVMHRFATHTKGFTTLHSLNTSSNRSHGTGRVERGASSEHQGA